MPHRSDFGADASILLVILTVEPRIERLLILLALLAPHQPPILLAHFFFLSMPRWPLASIFRSAAEPSHFFTVIPAFLAAALSRRLSSGESSYRLVFISCPPQCHWDPPNTGASEAHRGARTPS